MEVKKVVDCIAIGYVGLLSLGMFASGVKLAINLKDHEEYTKLNCINVAGLALLSTKSK